MQAPDFAPALVRPREHQMAAIRLIRPVVASRPLAEGFRERGRGLGVRRIYKRINDFTIVQGRGAPRDEERGKAHAHS